jgi:hypothetical protein
MLDTIKIIFLFINSTIILFTLFRLKRKHLKLDELGFLFASFLLTLLLAIIIGIKPHHILRAKFNISNLITYLFYFILISIFFIKYIRLILRFKYFLIIVSFTFFGLANSIDLLSDGRLIDLNNSELIENYFHLLGIIFWLLFFTDYAISSKRNTNKY